MSRRRTEEDFLAPDLTPLIDVVFILLIFFLVSSVFKKQELALLLKLPGTDSTDKVDPNKKNINIEITDNQIAVNGKIVSLKNLGATLERFNSNTTVQIRSDEKTHYVRVIHVLDLLRKLDLRNINLITTKL